MLTLTLVALICVPVFHIKYPDNGLPDVIVVLALNL